MTKRRTPPALAALAALPQLAAQHSTALDAQARRIAERTAQLAPQPARLAALDAQIRQGGGLIAFAGVLGSGLTTLLCQLAAERPYAFWLPADDQGGGLAALCAQVVALAGLQPALISPAAGRDTATLERLLGEAGAARAATDPLVVLIGRAGGAQATPLAQPFPATVPPGVVLVCACAPGAPPPQAPQAWLHAAEHALTPAQLAAVAVCHGGTPAQAAQVAELAEGSLLYVRLAAELLQSGAFQPSELPAGLAALHQRWWARLGAAGRRIAALLAAAGEPIEPALLAELGKHQPAAIQAWLHTWRPFLEIDGRQVQLYHPATRAFVAEQTIDQLASAHGAYAALALARAGDQPEQLDPYLLRQLARHAALAPSTTRTRVSRLLARRSWAIARERQSGSMHAAADDLAWLLHAAAQGDDLLDLLRHALLAGILAHLGRSLHPDAPAEAFEVAIQQGGAREPLLRRVREILGQIPDGRDKAQALRRLGEVCYARRMRASAMRMLSEAIDLETPGPPRQWREEREEALVACARAAIAIDVPQTALGITARIGHAERRGLIETEAVRWLLARGQRTRAEEVAYAIGHTAMHEWAMAEVAVGHVRAGAAARGETVLGTLKTATAVAWARTELACDAARRGDQHAVGRLAPITNPSLVDRALALLAPVLAAHGQLDAALETASTIEDRSIRTRALIDLALQHGPGAAALAAAANELAGLAGDERAPLVAELAAAQAMSGKIEQALRTTELLAEEEERDRAQSRVAVALARNGRTSDARIVAEAIGDDDERDWAFDELARLALARDQWDEALILAQQIAVAEQRARTQADLAIARARAGHALYAHAMAAQIERPAERMRALVAIAEPLIAQGGLAAAQALAAQLADPEQRSRYLAAVAAALATYADPHSAHALAHTIARPLERARALIAIARATTLAHQSLARRALGEALELCAHQGRAETLKCIEWAADTLAHLGGAELLLAAASAIDEIDSWWHT